MPFLTQPEAIDFLAQSEGLLQELDTAVHGVNGVLPSADRANLDDNRTILHRQLTRTVLLALQAIATNTSFKPALLKSSENSGIKKDAFCHGCFGVTPDAHQCLAVIFENKANHDYWAVLKRLGNDFLTSENARVLNQLYDNISKKIPESSLSPVLLDELIATVSDTNNWQQYGQAMQELAHYTASPVVQEEMLADFNQFKELQGEMAACLNDIKNMHIQGQIDTVRARKQIATLGQKIDDVVLYFNKRNIYVLEGQGNSKEAQLLEKKPLWDRICYHLVQFFRFAFMLLSFGLIKNDNPLAKKAGYGTFFLYKPQTRIEEKDIINQKYSIRMLSDKLSDVKDRLKDLVKEVDELDASLKRNSGI
ncbi:MAG: hypothetical protein P1U61_04885 [Legionellaceae bacterium]|nr:hypothetical protein [Legionellaceae bacterium]